METRCPEGGGPHGPPSLETFLRGMETTYAKQGPMGPQGLETFLRGMETRPVQDARLNRGNLETFLRGMETRWPRPRPCPPRTPLKPSLEGWKRSACPSNSLTVLTLKPSLEGWKHELPQGHLVPALGP